MKRRHIMGRTLFLLTRYLWQLPGSAPAERVREGMVRSTRAIAIFSTIVEVTKRMDR